MEMYAERSSEGVAYSKHHVLPTPGPYHEAGRLGAVLHYGTDIKETLQSEDLSKVAIPDPGWAKVILG